MLPKLLRIGFQAVFMFVVFTWAPHFLAASDSQNLEAELDANMDQLASLTKELAKANDEYNAADKERLEQMNDQSDPRVAIELTYPIGKSPKVFTKGWTFGARATVIPTFENGDIQTKDISSQVQWEGSGTFDPPQGNLSHPVFSSPGENTITLFVMIDGKKISKTFSVQAVSPEKYGRVGSIAYCPADKHGCMACPHSVQGPVQTGSAHVMIDGKPAARVGDTGVHVSCCGPNTFTIVKGDEEVLIDGKPAAKIDPGYGRTRHCGGDGYLIKG